jgi:SAM-dependent methyltransferase
MYGIDSDDNRPVDWGKTATDYAQHRPGPPESFYARLQALGIGRPKQRVLDLGTGTGVIARQMASQQCTVSACDIAPDQIAMAAELARQQGLEIDFATHPAERGDYPAHAFDIVIANQCFLYFDTATIAPLIVKWLKPNGVLVISHFSWLPRLDAVARATEELILQHNPQWSASGYAGGTAPRYPGLENWLHYCGYFYYDEEIPFSRQDCRGRVRASRGIGASLNSTEVEAFDAAHDAMLKTIANDTFTITHRIDAHILRAGTPTNTPAFEVEGDSSPRSKR